MYALGSISPLLVTGPVTGFDRPQVTQLVDLLSDGSGGLDQVFQDGNIPFRQASMTVVLQSSADFAFLRGYYEDGTIVNFTDGNGNTTTVRVLECGTRDFTGWWEADITLAEDEVEGS